MLYRMLRVIASYVACVRRDLQNQLVAKTYLALAEAEAHPLAFENAELDFLKISSEVGYAYVLALKTPRHWPAY